MLALVKYREPHHSHANWRRCALWVVVWCFFVTFKVSDVHEHCGQVDMVKEDPTSEYSWFKFAALVRMRLFVLVC